MTAFDDYEDAMLETRLSDRDIEDLLTGGTPGDERLAGLAQLIEGLRAHYRRDPAPDVVDTMAVRMAAVARIAGGRAPLRNGILRPRLALVLGAVLLAGTMAGAAIASDQAAPGDTLYGVDRALESVGIGNGAGAERLAEASALVGQGSPAEALIHASEAVAEAHDDGDQFELEQATEALLAAAERLRGLTQGGDNAQEVRGAVADLLEWMATTEERGPSFGEGVADRAREISAADEAGGDESAAEDELGEIEVGKSPVELPGPVPPSHPPVGAGPP